VEVSELRKRYGQVQAVDRVSFTVMPGEVLGLLGPNGAGKTSTMEIILGLRKPDSGIARILGMSHSEDSDRIKSRMGAQLQTTGMYPTHTVREMVELFAAFFPKSTQAHSLIERVGLQDKADARVKTLSGGQRQRLAIALALVNEPEVVFLDEPTTGLDPQARHSVWDLVQDLKHSGITVLLTTHYMEEAERLCDRVAILDQGRIIELDSPAALVNKHFRHIAIEFELPSGMPPEGFEGLRGVDNVIISDRRVTLYSADVPATMAALLDVASENGAPLQHIVVRQASLEDVFLKITGRSIRE
jgi:ABC-2 type transport system ATP-binding protein